MLRYSVPKKCVFSPIKMMQRMLFKEFFEIGLPADYMLACRNEDPARFEHTMHFQTCTVEVAGVMQHRACKNDIE